MGKGIWLNFNGKKFAAWYHDLYYAIYNTYRSYQSIQYWHFARNMISNCSNIPVANNVFILCLKVHSNAYLGYPNKMFIGYLVTFTAYLAKYLLWICICSVINKLINQDKRSTNKEKHSILNSTVYIKHHHLISSSQNLDPYQNFIIFVALGKYWYWYHGTWNCTFNEKMRFWHGKVKTKV